MAEPAMVGALKGQTGHDNTKQEMSRRHVTLVTSPHDILLEIVVELIAIRHFVRFLSLFFYSHEIHGDGLLVRHGSRGSQVT